MIVWVASFPKSGNTWVRSLLANWLADAFVDPNSLRGFTDMAPEPWYAVTGKSHIFLTRQEIDENRKWVHACIADKRLRDAMRPNFALGHGPDVFVKTHAALAEIDGHNTINPDVTKGAVYIVRDPRDVAVSYAAHLGLSVDEAIALMESPHPLKNAGSPLYQYVGRWCDHVESWTSAVGNVHLMRYEDLKRRPIVEFRKILASFGQKSVHGRIERAVEASSFANMQAFEAKNGFNERSDKSKEPFFRSGKAGGWKTTLTTAQAERIEAVHGATMEKMGYARSSLAVAA